LLEESGETDSFISLICLDVCQRSFRKLYTLEYLSDYIRIIVNNADPTIFILKDLNNDALQICKTVNNTIIFGDVVKVKFCSKAFYDKFVYGLYWYDEDGEELDVRILYEVIKNKTSI
jgi:hypothetical protein